MFSVIKKKGNAVSELNAKHFIEKLKSLQSNNEMNYPAAS